MNNNTDPKIQEIKERHRKKEDVLEYTSLEVPKSYNDIAYLLSEIERLQEGYEVLTQTPMDTHPSDTRDFAKRILKGEDPHRLNESALSHLKG